MAYLESKPRYEILDGLRGVAALMVVAYHLFETYIPQIGKHIINHGYLAVDFFFALSGFVIFPLVVAIGAGSRITDAHSLRWCKFLGEISFPLYIIHQPVTSLQMAWAESHLHLPVAVHIFVAVDIYLLSLGIAYAAVKLYAAPVREWPKEKWLKSGKS